MSDLDEAQPGNLTEPAPASHWASRPWLIVGGVLAVVAACMCVGLAATGFAAFRTLSASQGVGQTNVEVPLLYPGHVSPGEPHEPYNSDPPTSGAHYPESARAGFYTEAPPDELLVHNLEHGYVIIWYNCSGLTSSECEALQADIEAVMDRAGNSPITGTPKLIAVPRPTMDVLLALTTWGQLAKLDAFDEDWILGFIHAFRDKAPEPNVP